MDTNQAFELLKPEIEQIILEAPKEIKTAYIPVEGGEYISAAFHSMKLKPASDALEALSRQDSIELTPELEKKVKEYFRAYRLERGVISEEYEWKWLERWEIPLERRKGKSYRVYRFQAPTLWDLAPDAETKSNWYPVFKEQDIAFQETDEVLQF
jgi:hypothetical protein